MQKLEIAITLLASKVAPHLLPSSSRPTAMPRSLLVAAGLLLLAYAPSAGAQAPAPGDLPWNAPLNVVAARARRLGLTRTSAVGPDSAVVFAADRAGAHVELRTRFRNGRLWHAFYTVEGDSAAVKRSLDRAVNALSGRLGAPQEAPDGSFVWTLPSSRRFALPRSPARLESGRFGWAATYHAG